MGAVNIFEALVRIASHVENFGVFEGFRFTYLKQKKTQRLVSFMSKRVKTPVWLRTGSSDFVVYRDIFFNKQYDVTVNESPDIIIDAGANIGLATLFFANKFPGAKIIAIEPELENFNILKKNVSGYPNIICLNKAVWYWNTNLDIKQSEEGNWAFSVDMPVNQEEALVEAITFADILRLCDNKQLNLVKIDIEGAEKEVFLNFSAQWLTKIQTLIIETHDRVKPGCTKALFDCLNKTDYNVEVLADNFIIRIPQENE